MDFTGKQERNGATGSTATQTSAQPGPDATALIAAAKATSENVAMSRAHEAVSLIASPAGAGVDGRVIGAAGSVWEWDSGLAINEMPGERA